MKKSSFHTEFFIEISEAERYACLFNYVYDMVYYIVKDHPIAEDIFHESLLRAFTYPPKYYDSQKVKNWFRTLTRNTAYNYLRKLKRTRNELIIDNEKNFSLTIREHYLRASPVELEYEKKEMQEVIEKLLHSLNPDYRLLLELKYIHSLSYQDIAKKLRINEGAVRQKLARARNALKEKISRQDLN